MSVGHVYLEVVPGNQFDENPTTHFPITDPVCIGEIKEECLEAPTPYQLEKLKLQFKLKIHTKNLYVLRLK